MINLKMGKKRIVIAALAVAWLCCMPITGVTLWFACTAILSALVSLFFGVYGFICCWAADLLYKDKEELTSIERKVIAFALRITGQED